METSCRNLVKENQDMREDNNSSDEMTMCSAPDVGPLHINAFPDSIFIQIFSHLEFEDAASIAQTCRRWRDISADDLLWKGFFLRHYKLPPSTPMSPRGTSWLSEFKRLHDRIPCVLSETRLEHKDEVLHVSFSHDGSMFATCSKDGFFRVWKSKSPAVLMFERDMMTLFSWKYTQFSQFNETDTCLLVSGVYFGSLSTSGEIAVFDLQGDFPMQCRVNNKPYDVFGAWYDNDHLLSGTLKWTGNFTSVSAVWLSKASQEVESEMESVSMVLYRFENVNSSSIRLLHVAEVGTNEDEEDAQGAVPARHPRTSGVKRGGCNKRPVIRRTDRRNVVPREISKLLRKEVGEDDFDSSDEDDSDGNDSPPPYDPVDWRVIDLDYNENMKRKHDIVNDLDHEFTEFRPYFFESFRNILYRCDLPHRRQAARLRVMRGENDQTASSPCQAKIPGNHRCDCPDSLHHCGAHSPPPGGALVGSKDHLKMRRKVEGCSGGQGSPPSDPAGDDSTGGSRKKHVPWEERSHLARKGVKGYLVKERECCVKETAPKRSRAAPEPMIEISARSGHLPRDNLISDSSSDEEMEATGEGGSRESSSEEEEFKTHRERREAKFLKKRARLAMLARDENSDSDYDEEEEDFMGVGREGAGVSEDCQMGWEEVPSERLEEEENGSRAEDPGFMDNGTQTEGVCGEAVTAVSQSPPEASQGLAFASDLCKNRREKLLIYTWGSETYIPHKIGIKRMKPSDFSKGARETSVLLPDVRQNLHNATGTRRDVPDVAIDMHGHIVGLSLSPDQRYLYVNCRSWPKDCLITDPQESVPLAQEVEIFCIDLTTFQFTGPVLRSHKAYTDSDKCFFLNLDVSDDYVVSGAEDRRGYLWDRHYGIPLAHFEHQDVVNSVALNPRNPQMAISASDDHTIKVWKSRRAMRRQRNGKEKWMHRLQMW